MILNCDSSRDSSHFHAAITPMPELTNISMPPYARQKSPRRNSKSSRTVTCGPSQLCCRHSGEPRIVHQDNMAIWDTLDLAPERAIARGRLLIYTTSVRRTTIVVETRRGVRVNHDLFLARPSSPTYKWRRRGHHNAATALYKSGTVSLPFTARQKNRIAIG